jgi:hypothetical protein
MDGANGQTGGKNSSSTFVLTAFISFGLFNIFRCCARIGNTNVLRVDFKWRVSVWYILARTRSQHLQKWWLLNVTFAWDASSLHFLGFSSLENITLYCQIQALKIPILV